MILLICLGWFFLGNLVFQWSNPEAEIYLEDLQKRHAQGLVTLSEFMKLMANLTLHCGPLFPILVIIFVIWALMFPPPNV